MSESVSMRESELMTVPVQPFYRLPMGSQKRKENVKLTNHKEDNELLN